MTPEVDPWPPHTHTEHKPAHTAHELAHTAHEPAHTHTTYTPPSPPTNFVFITKMVSTIPTYSGST